MELMAERDPDIRTLAGQLEPVHAGAWVNGWMNRALDNAAYGMGGGDEEPRNRRVRFQEVSEATNTPGRMYS